MPVTYQPISTQTLGSAVASVTFSSIPSTYTDLVLVANATAASLGADSIDIQFNSDTANNYSTTQMTSTGSAASSTRGTSEPRIYGALISSSEISISIWHINNYANTTTYKTVLARGNLGSTYGVRQSAGLWRSTAAINAIKLYNDTAQNFAIGSTFTLYGIKAA